MKYFKYTLLLIPIIVVGMILGFLNFSKTDTALGGGKTDTGAIVNIDGTSTSSVVYLGVDETSSKEFSVAGADKFSIDTIMNASTTASVLTLEFYVSNNKIDWYGLPNVTADSGIANTVGSTTAAYTFTPQVSGDNKFSVLINPSDHNYFKVVRSALTASSSVWQQVILSKGY